MSLSPTSVAQPLATTAGDPTASRLSPSTALLMSVWLGLCAGYVDLVLILGKKLFMDEEGWYRTGRDFPWTVPLGHVVLSLAVGLFVALTCWSRTKGVSLRRGSSLLATFALWFAFLRLPVYSVASLLLALGVGSEFGKAATTRGFSLRVGWVRRSLAAFLVLLALLFGASTGREMFLEHRAIAGLQTSTSKTRNVILIVLDTVRASHMSLYNYPRDTTPNLIRWAKKGVKYNSAIAPAPWTLPSHGSFFTGRWPFEFDSQSKPILDTSSPTLAEYLQSRGYQTAGFIANTTYCNYETKLNRGFIHFEDYSLTPQSLLSRTVPGKWMLKRYLSLVDHYAWKWVELQSKGASELNDNVLGWLERRRTDRPFFAFLNYFDTHEPYFPPSGFEGRFGYKPTKAKDYQFLIDYLYMNKSKMNYRDFLMARDCYDDTLAYLDKQVGRLLDDLQNRGILENTVVIITADHGEAFGDHGTFLHSHTVFLEEVGVPLLILAPGVPTGRTVSRAVSLRDLPATVVDLLGLEYGSPFPGRSLTESWSVRPGEIPKEPSSPAVSEQASTLAFQPHTKEEEGRGHQMSLVALDRYQYIRAGNGVETIFDIKNDPNTQMNLIGSTKGDELVDQFRGMLLKILTEHPGTAKVENAYLRRYRESLADQVRRADEKRITSLP